MLEIDDFTLVLKRKVPLSRWLLDLHKTKNFMEYASDDKAPFFYCVLHFMKNLIKSRVYAKKNKI